MPTCAACGGWLDLDHIPVRDVDGAYRCVECRDERRTPKVAPVFWRPHLRLVHNGPTAVPGGGR